MFTKEKKNWASKFTLNAKLKAHDETIHKKITAFECGTCLLKFGLTSGFIKAKKHDKKLMCPSCDSVLHLTS